MNVLKSCTFIRYRAAHLYTQAVIKDPNRKKNETHRATTRDFKMVFNIYCGNEWQTTQLHAAAPATTKENV